MFTYIVNDLAFNWLNNGAITSTTTPTAVDLINAVGPVLMAVKAISGGSGTLSVQPVMSTDNVTFVNVPADAILDPTTGLPNYSIPQLVGSTGTEVKFGLKRDELMRYISITYTPVGSASMTVNAAEMHLRPYSPQTGV